MYRSVSIVALSFALLGCNSSAKPDGQVIATVDGTEITRTQLNAALPKVGSKLDPAVVRNAVLDQLVMQQVVVDEAKRQGIDRSQEYLLASRRANDQILSDLLSQRVLRSLRTPYAKDVDQFIVANPTRFAERVVMSVDQLRFPEGTLDAATLAELHSIDAVLARLALAKVQVQRGRATVDSATLTPVAYRQLLALPAGEPFVVHEGGLTIVSTIISKTPAPIMGDNAQKLAMQILQQEASRTALVKQLQTLRQNAKVEYQPGFAAPKTAQDDVTKPLSATSTTR